LRKECFKFIPVTATCDVILHAESKARFADVFILPSPANYKDISDVHFNNVEDLQSKNSKAKKIKSVNSIVSGILERPPRHGLKFILINVLSIIKDQQAYVMDHELQLSRTVNGVNYRSVYICMNSESYIIQSDFDIVKKLSGCNNKRFDGVFKLQDNGNGRYIFKADKAEELCHILDTFEFLNNFRRFGIRIGSIVLLCAQMASRGLSFVSSSRKIHLTDMVCSEKLDLSTAYQSMRILGNFSDDVALTVHCPLKFEVDIKTIVNNNRTKFDIIQNVDGVTRMPTELIVDHIKKFEYRPTVSTCEGYIPVSKKSFCSKIKGDIRLKFNAKSKTDGEHIVGESETLEEAVERVYGSCRNIQKYNKMFEINLPLIEKEFRRGNALNNFKRGVIEQCLNTFRHELSNDEVVWLNKYVNNEKDKPTMKVSYDSVTDRGYYRNPMFKLKNHSADITYNGSIICIRTCPVFASETFDDNIIAWYGADKKLYFTEKLENGRIGKDTVMNDTVSDVIKVSL
jgi:hypothetical protein